MEGGCDPSAAAAHLPHYHHHRPFACPLLNSAIFAASPCFLHRRRFTPPFLCPFHCPSHHHLSPPPPFPLHPTSQAAEPVALQPWSRLEDQNVALHDIVEGEEQEEEEEEEPVFVMTDEWMEFFAKSEVKRRLNKKKKKQMKVNK